MHSTALWMVACLLAPSAEHPATVASAVVAKEQDAAKLLEELNAKFKAQEDAFRKASRAATTKEARDEAAKLRPDAAAFTKSYAEVARLAGGGDVALEAWSRALELSIQAPDWEVFDEAAVRLVEDFADSESLAKLAATLVGATAGGRGEHVLREMRREAGTDATRAAATFHLGLLLLNPPRGSKPDGDPAARAKEGLALLREVCEKYPDAADARGNAFAKQAGSHIFQAERLQVGMVVPEIEAPDTSGVSFKLSDYRGKVVLLDFWGDW